MHEQSAGFGATDFQNTQDNMFMKDIGGYVGTVGASSDDRQSLPEEISFAEVENAIGALQSLAEEVSVKDTIGDSHGEGMNMMDTMGDLGTDQDSIPVQDHVLQKQSHKPSEDLNEADSSKISESPDVNPNESIEGQLLSSESLGMTYSQQEPTVVICGSTDVSTQDTTMNPRGYHVIDEKGSGQEGILGAPTNTFSHGYVARNLFESQISEEYLPQDELNAKREGCEKLNQTNKLETVKEDNDDGLLPEGEASEDQKESQDVEGDVEKMENEAMDGDIAVEMNEAGEKVEESKGDQNKEGFPEGGEGTSQGEMEEGENHATALHTTPKPTEEPPKKRSKETENVQQEDKGGLNIFTVENTVEGKVKEAKGKETTPAEKSIRATLVDDEIPLDRRRSQRRTASPKRLSPSKSPAKHERKIEPKVHGTRKAAQRQTGAGQQETQKDKKEQLGTQKDKTGQLGHLGTQKDKVEQEGSQKNEKEHGAIQGVKRKRGRPPKVPRNEEDVGSSESTKNSKSEMMRENRNSPSKRMKSRKD